MDLILKDILTSYSLPTVIIAVIVCAVSLTLNKFFNKIPKFVRVYIPFVVAIILYSVYDMIFVFHNFILTSQTLYAGIFSGSLSTIIYSIVIKVLQGKPINTNSTIILIESILQGYIDQNLLAQTACQIESLFLGEGDDYLREQNIIDTLSNLSQNISHVDICRLAKLIITAVNSIKKP